MPSNDNYITIDRFNAGIQELKTEIQKNNTSIQVINTNINNLGKRLDDIQFFFSLFLVVITIMIAVIGFIPMIDATVARTQLKAGN